MHTEHPSMPTHCSPLRAHVCRSGDDHQENCTFSESLKPTLVESQTYSPTADARQASFHSSGGVRNSFVGRGRVLTQPTFSPYSSTKLSSRYNFVSPLRPLAFNEAPTRSRDPAFVEDTSRFLDRETPPNHHQTFRGSPSSIPVRIFLPQQYADPNSLETTLFSKENPDHSSIMTKPSADTRFPGTVVCISGLSREIVLKILVRLCRKISHIISQNLASLTNNPLDADLLLRGIVALVPERAVSMVIGYKGTTINRMCKRFNCDIRMLSIQKVQIQSGLADRLVLFRGGDMTNVSKAICHINNFLNAMIRQRRLTEAEVSCSVLNPEASHPQSMFLSSPMRMVQPCRPMRPLQPLDESSVSQTHPRGAIATCQNNNNNNNVSNQKRSMRRFFQDYHRSSAIPRTTSLSLQPWAFSITPHLFRHVMSNRKASMSLKLVIDKHHAAWIIGNSGSHKKYLESTSGATINIYNRSVENLLENFRESRVMIIRGTPLMLSLAVNLIFMGYEHRERHMIQTQDMPVRLILSRESSALILEKGVRVLKAIAYRSGVKVSLLPHVQLDRNIVNLKGFATQKVTALILILEYLLRKKKRLDILEHRKTPLHSPGKHLAPLEENPSQERGESEERHMERGECSQLTDPTRTQINQKLLVMEPPEASFLRHVSNNVTYPKVITTCLNYSMILTFPSKYRSMLSNLGPTAFHDIEAMLNYRVGCRVHILQRHHPKDSKLDQKMDSKLDQKMDQKMDSKLDQKMDQKMDSKLDQKMDQKIDQKIDQKMDQKMDSKLDQKIDQKIDPRESCEHYATKVEHQDQDELLEFELMGTPIGNSTAVLLIHEVLHNLEHSTALG